MRLPALAMLAIGIALALSSCIFEAFGFAHDQKLVGPYHLVGVDAPEEMTLCIRHTEGCTGVGIEATVMAAGYDSRFIVVLRKPADRFGQTLGTPDEYWVIQRDLAAEARGEGEDAMGPYTANEYAGLAEQNAFPEFTIAFDDLR